MSDPVPVRLAAHVRERPDDLAFRFASRPGRPTDDLTWGAFGRRVASAAAGLREHSAPGSRVGIACTETPDVVVAIAACLVSGRVAVPLPTALSRRSAPRAEAVLSAARPELVAVSGEVPDWLHLGEATAMAMPPSADDALVDVPPPAGDDLALLQFSSGSTGSPKGVAITHANLAANCASIAAAYGLSHLTRGLSWLPLHHDMGLIGHVMTPLWLGCRSTLTSPLRFLQRPLTWLAHASEERATITSAPNFAYELAARAAESAGVDGLDLSSLTTLVCGGERVVESTMRRFIAAFVPAGLDPAAIAPSYGLAEATLLVASGRQAGGPRFVAPRGGGATFVDLGEPVESVAVRIARVDGSEAAEGEVGEIEISGPAVGRILKGAGEVPSPSGPVATGDLGYMEAGRLRVSGRLKEIIIVRGQNIAASDAEAAAVAADDGVAAGGACAVAAEHDGTEHLVVVVEMSRGHDGITAVDLAHKVSEAVAHATGVVPGRVVVSPAGALPRTPSGKVQRHIAGEMLLAQSLRLL